MKNPQPCYTYFYKTSEDGTKLTFLNYDIESIVGMSVNHLEADPMAWFNFILTEDRKRVKEFYVKRNKQYVSNTSIQYKIQDLNGSVREILDNAFVATDDNGSVVGLFGTMVDLTLINEQKQYAVILDAVHDLLSRESLLNRMGVEFIKILVNNLPFDYSELWLLDESKENLLKLADYLKEPAKGHQSIKQDAGLARIKNKGILKSIIDKNEIYWSNNFYDRYDFADMENSIYSEYDSMMGIRLAINNIPLGLLILLSKNMQQPSPAVMHLLRVATGYVSIYIMHKLEEQFANYSQSYDEVTRLPHRNMFIKTLQTLLVSPQNSKVAIFKMMIDNENKHRATLGSESVNAILKELSTRILSRPHPNLLFLSKSDLSHFGFILNNMNDIRQIISYATSLLEVAHKPFLVNSQEIHITCSMGIAFYPNDGIDAAELMKSAYTALTTAAALGGDKIMFSSPTLEYEFEEKLKIKAGLSKALNNSEFILYYQPKVNMLSGDVVGVEALLRWQDLHGVLHKPKYFLEVAEQTRLIIAIGEWVFREVCTRLSNQEIEVPVAVNISIVQLEKQSKFVDFVRTTLEEFDIDPRKLEFEITESILMHDQDMIDELRKFNALGINVTLDDFCIKYCSLSYLRKYTPNRIKIDKAYCNGVPHDLENAAILKAMIAMGKSLNIVVTVEGAETVEQVRFLLEQECEELQSFYISRPVPLSELQKLVRTNFLQRIRKALK